MFQQRLRRLDRVVLARRHRHFKLLGGADFPVGLVDLRLLDRVGGGQVLALLIEVAQLLGFVRGVRLGSLLFREIIDAGSDQVGMRIASGIVRTGPGVTPPPVSAPAGPVLSPAGPASAPPGPVSRPGSRLAGPVSSPAGPVSRPGSDSASSEMVPLSRPLKGTISGAVSRSLSRASAAARAFSGVSPTTATDLARFWQRIDRAPHGRARSSASRARSRGWLRRGRLLLRLVFRPVEFLERLPGETPDLLPRHRVPVLWEAERPRHPARPAAALARIVRGWYQRCHDAAL